MDTSPATNDVQGQQSRGRERVDSVGFQAAEEASDNDQPWLDIARRWPLASVAGALIAGYVAARIMNRNRKS